jgi:hypothetical protein
MSDVKTQTVVLARALYEIRLLLSGYLGRQTVGDINVRQAAHLAYAFHNEALAVAERPAFDPFAAVRRLKAVDAMLSSEFSEIFGALLDTAG